MKLKVCFTFCFTIVLLSTIQAESYKVKKLLDELKSVSQPEAKIGLYIAIANEIKGSQPDSSLYYLSQAENLIKEIDSKSISQNISIRLLLGRTSVEVAKGNYEKAWDMDSLALEGARKLNNRELEAQALMSKGGILYQLSEFDKAQEINHEALKLVRTTSDYKTEGKILTNMGTIEFMFGNAQKADSLFKIPLQIAERQNDDDLLAASYLNIGLLAYYIGNLDLAKEYYNKSIEIYRKIDGKDGLIICYQNMANTFYQQGDIEKAIEFYTLNSNIALELDDKSGLGKACQNLGESYSQIGNLEKALAYFLQSLDIRTVLGDKKGIALTHSSIGHIHFMRDNFVEALEYYRNSLKMYSEIGYALGVADQYSDVGNIMQELKIYDSALFYYQKASGFYEKNENLNHLANIYLNTGRVYLAKNDFDEAEKYFQNSEKLKVQTEDNIGIYNAKSLTSSLHLKKAGTFPAGSSAQHAELEVALGFARESFALAGKINNLVGQRESSGLLMDILSKLGNEKEALKYASIKLETSDSLNKMQRAEALANAEIGWKAQKKQEEIDRLENEKTLQQQVISQKSTLNRQLIFLLVFILVAIVLIISVSVLIMKNKRRKNDLERQKHILEVTRLKMQNINNRLSPHLFFNLLHSVSGEPESTGKTRDKIGQVASLLRKSLENSEQTAITLAEELEMVKNYIALQENRIPPPFEMSINIGENVNAETRIPPMMLQIPVENAIKHGLMPFEGEKQLLINITQNHDRLVLKVEDNGIGRKNSTGRTAGTGTGLKVLLQTIHLLNQNNREKIVFIISDKEPSGTIVEIQIPLNFNYEL